ncbi:hypothetical protein EWM64_g4635 [Hericium alpestre]|uniref:RlpA-like protein double-psi beta-barrel domain-containing protein n=1 Tax=Hericium alpestre TaxID=135208 RepID=A0A4Y9ZWW3_9AGAM|nr:hypothetical protein EWM64_g4635 [Hericium alpestre]
MRFSSTLISCLLALILPYAAAVEHGPKRHHRGISRQASSEQTHVKRVSGGKMTFYDVGQGACGATSKGSDFVAALSKEQYGDGYPGPNCWKKITITYQGKSAQATIVDECPGCAYGALDLSRGLFDYFAPESTGVIYADWEFS